MPKSLDIIKTCECVAPEFGVVKLEYLMHYITYFKLIWSPLKSGLQCQILSTTCVEVPIYIQWNPLISTFYISTFLYIDTFSNSRIFSSLSSLMNFSYIDMKICPFSYIDMHLWGTHTQKKVCGREAWNIDYTMYVVHVKSM